MSGDFAAYTERKNSEQQRGSKQEVGRTAVAEEGTLAIVSILVVLSLLQFVGECLMAYKEF